MPYPYDPLDPYIGAYGGRRLTGRPRGSPAGMPYQAREASPFGLTRERIFDELENDPKLQQNSIATPPPRWAPIRASGAGIRR